LKCEEMTEMFSAMGDFHSMNFIHPDLGTRFVVDWIHNEGMSFLGRCAFGTHTAFGLVLEAA
jgi:hypothetical protein